jgi:hypothetical protein
LRAASGFFVASSWVAAVKRRLAVGSPAKGLRAGGVGRERWWFRPLVCGEVKGRLGAGWRGGVSRKTSSKPGGPGSCVCLTGSRVAEVRVGIPVGSLLFKVLFAGPVYA